MSAPIKILPIEQSVYVKQGGTVGFTVALNDGNQSLAVGEAEIKGQIRHTPESAIVGEAEIVVAETGTEFSVIFTGATTGALTPGKYRCDVLVKLPDGRAIFAVDVTLFIQPSTTHG